MILFILSLWFIVCLSFVFLGKDFDETALPRDKRLVVYSTLVFLLTSLYYTVSFTRETVPVDPAISPWTCVLAISLSCTGAFLMCLSRWELRSLSLPEMVFSLNPIKNTVGAYRYLRHPMYLGIVLLLCGTFVIYPTTAGLALFLTIVLVLWKKAVLEEPSVFASYEK